MTNSLFYKQRGTCRSRAAETRVRRQAKRQRAIKRASSSKYKNRSKILQTPDGVLECGLCVLAVGGQRLFKPGKVVFAPLLGQNPGGGDDEHHVGLWVGKNLPRQTQ